MADRIRASVTVRQGSSATELLAAIRDYAAEKAGNPWSLESRRPLVLRHASPRAEGVKYAFERDERDAVELRISGKRARLGLAYAMTLLANPRLADHVGSVNVELGAD